MCLMLLSAPKTSKCPSKHFCSGKYYTFFTFNFEVFAVEVVVPFSVPRGRASAENKMDCWKQFAVFFRFFIASTVLMPFIHL